jgi:hypothetical protein
MRTVAVAIILLAFCFISSGCRKDHLRPGNVPLSAVLIDGTFIDCSVDNAVNKNHCTVYKGGSGEILADGLFVVGYPPRAGNKAELRYAAYRTVYLDRYIILVDSQLLSLEEASERDPTNRLINDKLKSLSSSSRGPATDCGKTSTNRPEDEVSSCAWRAFSNGKPFYVRYSWPGRVSYFSYGLAGDGGGNLFEVAYDIRGLLNFGLSKNAQVFDDNHIRVTTCPKPVAFGKTEEGIPACILPINEGESAMAAQQRPIETTVCAITENPSAFNNKLVRVHGDVSGNFEYSELGEAGCSDSIWFAYENGGAPPGLVAHVNGGAEPGAQDSEGRRILPVPVKLVQDSNFNRFQRLMKARVRADARYEKTNPNEYVFHRVTATFVGRIDAVSPDIHAFHLKRTPTDRADFLGFGQMGLFDAQFVLQSVENDAVLRASPPIPRAK